MNTDTRTIQKIVKTVISEYEAQLPCKVDTEIYVKHSLILEKLEIKLNDLDEVKADVKTLRDKVIELITQRNMIVAFSTVIGGIIGGLIAKFI